MHINVKLTVLLLGGLEVLGAVVAERAGVVRGQLALAGLEVAADGADIALDLLLDDGNDVLEVLGTVLAQGADEVRGQLASLVEVAADLADIALALSGGGILLGLDVGVIVGVGAALVLGQHLCLNNVCYVKHLSLDVLYVDDLAGEDGVCILCDIGDAV